MNTYSEIFTGYWGHNVEISTENIFQLFLTSNSTAMLSFYKITSCIIHLTWLVTYLMVKDDRLFKSDAAELTGNDHIAL